jgi:hypothetical protein
MTDEVVKYFSRGQQRTLLYNGIYINTSLSHCREMWVGGMTGIRGGGGVWLGTHGQFRTLKKSYGMRNDKGGSVPSCHAFSKRVTYSMLKWA